MEALKRLYCEMQGCRRCRLSEIEKNRRKLLPQVEGKVLIISQNPSFYYSSNTIHVWGGLDSLPFTRFEKFLDDHGFSVVDLSVTNLIKCTFPENAIPPDVDEIIDTCSYWLMKEIAQLKPHCIIAMGKLTRDFFNLKLGQKGYWNFIPVFTTRHPAYVQRRGNYEDFFKVFEKALSFKVTKGVKNEKAD